MNDGSFPTRTVGTDIIRPLAKRIGTGWLNEICFEVIPFNGEIQNFQISPPLISLFYQSVPKSRLVKNPASPRGKPRGANLRLLPCNEPGGLGKYRMGTRPAASLKIFNFPFSIPFVPETHILLTEVHPIWLRKSNLLKPSFVMPTSP